MDNVEFLTTGDAAKILDVSPDFIRQLVRAGRLPALTTRSGQRLFFEADVEHFAQARAAKQRKLQRVVSVLAGDDVDAMPNTSMSKPQDNFLRQEDFIPNLNAATIAGRVIKVEPLTGSTPGLAVTLGYMKRWSNGARQEIPIRIYTTGADRIEKLDWLKVGETILAHGELTDKGALYAHQLEWLSRPPRQPGDGDQFLEGMQATQTS